MANIYNSKLNKVVNGTSDDDSIKNGYYSNYYEYTAGNDSTISAGDGDDTIENYGNHVSINTGAGNDSVYNYGGSYNSDYATIDTGAGDDSVYNSGYSVTIAAGAGNDRISNTGSNVSIAGGTGNDSIYNHGDSVTINGDRGNDYISISGANNLIKYRVGDGNDTIQGFRADSTLSISGDSYSKRVSGNDIIVNVGMEKITLIGAASLPSVNIAGVEVFNYIDLSDDNNAFKNTVDEATIVAMGGNDTLNNYGDNALIDGGAGNDKIRNYGDGALIDCVDGNDSVRNYADNVTINGGTGNDTLRNYGEEVVFDYVAGDGNDKIYGFDETSTLSISGDGYSTTKSGNNIIVTVGDGKITLAGAANLEELNIEGTLKEKNLKLTDSDAATVTLPTDYESADASARTTAIQITGNALDNSIIGGNADNTIAGGAGNDSLYGNTGNDSINGGSGDDYIQGSGGNDKLYGYTGNDTLWGGEGNDSLWGQAGADIFVYFDGDDYDIIYSFDDTDMLEISGDFTATYNAKTKAVSFNVGYVNDAIVLKNFTASTFKVNGENYVISGNTLAKK